MKKITLFIIISFLSQTHFASSASLEGTYPNNSALYGTPTVMSFDMQSMQLCESVSPSTGACVGDNTYTFIKTMTGRCDIASVTTANTNACVFSDTTAGITKNITYNYVRVSMTRDVWLKGTVTSANSNIAEDSRTCSTSSSITNSGTVFPMGAISSTPSTQITTFANGPGNDTFVGGITDPANLPNTTSGGTQVLLNLPYLDNLGLVKGNHYNWAANYTTPTPHVWQSALDSADTEVVLIYRLSSSYTKTTDTNPSVKMTFDVTNAISSQWFKVTNDDSTSSYACTMYLEKPLVTMTIE